MSSVVLELQRGDRYEHNKGKINGVWGQKNHGMMGAGPLEREWNLSEKKTFQGSSQAVLSPQNACVFGEE